MSRAENIKQQIKQLLSETKISVDTLYAMNPLFDYLKDVMTADETVKAYCLSMIERKPHKAAAGKWLVVSTEERLLFLSKSQFSSLDSFFIPYSELIEYKSKAGWLLNDINFISTKMQVRLFHVGKKDYTFFWSAYMKVMQEGKSK